MPGHDVPPGKKYICNIWRDRVMLCFACALNHHHHHRYNHHRITVIIVIILITIPNHQYLADDVDVALLAAAVVAELISLSVGALPVATEQF